MADALNNNDYVKVGYKYLAVGDCWQAKARDSQGRLQPDKERFPSGIKSTADYVCIKLSGVHYWLRVTNTEIPGWFFY